MDKILGLTFVTFYGLSYTCSQCTPKYTRIRACNTVEYTRVLIYTHTRAHALTHSYICTGNHIFGCKHSHSTYVYVNFRQLC